MRSQAAYIAAVGATASEVRKSALWSKPIAVPAPAEERQESSEAGDLSMPPMGGG